MYTMYNNVYTNNAFSEMGFMNWVFKYLYNNIIGYGDGKKKTKFTRILYNKKFEQILCSRLPLIMGTIHVL